MTTTELINQESKRLFDVVLQEYYKQDNYKRRPFSILLDNHISKFNTVIQEGIKKSINSMLTTDFGISNAPGYIIEDLKLSEMLYKNGKDVNIRALNEINNHLKRNSSVDTLRKMLYDGYNYNQNDILPLQKELPKYLLRKDKIQAMQLKTKSLKAAYLKTIESKTLEAFENNMQYALEEKSRFYARRIAITEKARSFNLANTKDILQDDDIDLVRYEMSHKHPMVDICDYYANLDVGYGKGIVPKDQMITLPLHPFCMCKYEPYYGRVKKKTIDNPEKKTIEKFSESDQKRILGGNHHFDSFKQGVKPIDIFNKLRPNYPIKFASDTISSMKKDF